MQPAPAKADINLALFNLLSAFSITWLVGMQRLISLAFACGNRNGRKIPCISRPGLSNWWPEWDHNMAHGLYMAHKHITFQPIGPIGGGLSCCCALGEDRGSCEPPVQLMWWGTGALCQLWWGDCVLPLPALVVGEPDKGYPNHV